MHVRRWHACSNSALLLSAPQRRLIWLRKMGTGALRMQSSHLDVTFLIPCILSVHTHEWQCAQVNSSITGVVWDPSASHCSRCSSSPAQRRKGSFAEHHSDYAVREIISMGHGNLEQNKFLLLHSRGGWRIESCWTPLSGGSFLVQKARLSLSYLLATLGWLSGWRRQTQTEPTVSG